MLLSFIHPTHLLTFMTPRSTRIQTNRSTALSDSTLHPASPSTVHLTASQIRTAAPAWRALTLFQRAAQLEAFATLLEAHRGPIVTALQLDTASKVSSQEFSALLACIRRWTSGFGHDLLSESVRPSETTEGYLIRTTFRPYHLVGVIAPWNVPLYLSFIDAVPALIAGCAVVMKPSEMTPRFVQPLLEVLDRVEGELGEVLRVVVGRKEVGKALVDCVDMVCFTGGVEVGRMVARQCAERMIPVYLELGGKDPVIVDETAELETASSAIVWGGLLNTGQNCFSVERVYVLENVYEEFVHMLVEKVREVEENGDLAPMTVAKQGEVIRAQIADAVSKGAKIEVGGKVYKDDEGATWVQGTVVTNVNHNMEIMREETFGPVIAVMRVSSVDEAVELANDSVYGLSGAVFSLPKKKAMEIGDRLNVGLVGINQAGASVLVGDAEKTSFGISGLGVCSRNGKISIMRFVRTCAQVVKQNPLQHDPWWFNKEKSK